MNETIGEALIEDLLSRDWARLQLCPGCLLIYSSKYDSLRVKVSVFGYHSYTVIESRNPLNILEEVKKAQMKLLLELLDSGVEEPLLGLPDPGEVEDL